MPKPRKRRTTISNEEKTVKDEESVIDGQRSTTDGEIQKSTEVTSSADVNSPATKRAKLGKVKDRQYDKYCWICHKEECEQKCSLCPRVYHIQCVNRHEVSEEDWMCPECLNISLSDKKCSTSPILAMLTTEQFCSLLKYTLHRMKIHVPQDFCIDNSSSVFYPMDFNILEKNIRKKAYTTTASFLADVKWILHNHSICSSHGMPVIKTILKVCQEELREIETCPDCYLHAYSMKDKWFSEPCRKPHTLVWAKLKGFPIWPAKAVKSANGNVDVRFFGGHERAWVPVGQVYFLTRDPPQAITSQKKNFEIAIQEVDLHIKLLTQRFGGYEYAPEKIPFSPSQLYLHLNITLNKLCSNPQSSRDKRKYEMPSVSSKRRSSKSQEIQGIKKDGQKKEQESADISEQDIAEQEILDKKGETGTSSTTLLDLKSDVSVEEIGESTVKNISVVEDIKNEGINKTNTNAELSSELYNEEEKQSSKNENFIENINSAESLKEKENKLKSNDIINYKDNEQQEKKDSESDNRESLELSQSNKSNIEESENYINNNTDSVETKIQGESNLMKETNEAIVSEEKNTKHSKANLNSVEEESEKECRNSTSKETVITDKLNENINSNGQKENSLNNAEDVFALDNSSLNKTEHTPNKDQEFHLIHHEESINNSLILHEKSNVEIKEKKDFESKESNIKSNEFSNTDKNYKKNCETVFEISKKEINEKENLSSKLNETEEKKSNFIENGIDKEAAKNVDITQDTVESIDKSNSDSKDTQKSQSPNSLRIRIVKGKVESKSNHHDHSNKAGSIKSNKQSKKCEFSISSSNNPQNSSHKEKSSTEHLDHDQTFNSKNKVESAVPNLAVRKSKRPRKNFIIQFPWKIMSKNANSDEDTSKEKYFDDNQPMNICEDKVIDATDPLNSSKELDNSEKIELSSDKTTEPIDTVKNVDSPNKLQDLENSDLENIKDKLSVNITDASKNLKLSKQSNSTDEIKASILEDLSKNKIFEDNNTLKTKDSESNKDSIKIQISRESVKSPKTQVTENNLDSLKVKILEDTVDSLRPQVLLDNIDLSKTSSQINVDSSKKQVSQNSSDLPKSSESQQEKCLKNVDLPINIISYQSKPSDLTDTPKDKIIQIKTSDSLDLLKTSLSQNKSTDVSDSVKTSLIQEKNIVPSNSLKTVIVLDKFMEKPLDSNSLKSKIVQEKKSNYTGKSKFVHPSTILEKLDKVKIAKSPVQQNTSAKKQDQLDIQKITTQSPKTNTSSVFSHIAKILGQPSNLNSNVTTSMKSPAISVLSLPKSTESAHESSMKKSLQIFNKNTNNLNTSQPNSHLSQEIEVDHCNDLDMECINEEENSIRKAMDNCLKDIPLTRQELKINNTQLTIQNLQQSTKYNTTSNIRNETNAIGTTSQAESAQNSRQPSCTNEKNLFNILPVEKYARKLTVFLTNTLEEMCQDIINSGCMQVAIHSLEKEIENLQEKHKKEMLDVKQNTDLIVKEMRSTIETEKQNAISEVRRQCELEMRKNIEETKKKQWCANCGKEAVFYCCWNTSYCDYPCQQAHWPQHMSTCGQNHVTTVKEQLVTNMPNLGPEMTITQSPAIHGNLPVRIQFAGLHNQTQITQQTNKQKNKKKCQFPVDQLGTRRKNGNLNISQSPTSTIQQTDVRLSPHPSTQILGANYTLQGGQVIPVSLQHNTPHPKQCAPNSTIEMKSHTVHPMSFPFNPHVCM